MVPVCQWGRVRRVSCRRRLANPWRSAQARQLTKAGCKKVFRDVHVSGAKTNRAQLRRVIDQLDAGDVLMVTRLDRLGRSTRDLLNTLAAITDRKAGFRSLTDTC